MKKSIEDANIKSAFNMPKRKVKNSSYVGLSMEELKEASHTTKQQTTKKTDIPKKMVNTQVPAVVFDAFLLYCAKNNLYRNNAFPSMLTYVLSKYKKDAFQFEDKINGVLISESKKVSANFEVPIELMQDVRAWKAIKKVNYQEIYTQALVQYLNQQS